jgi:hypothetical protein
LSLPCLGAGSAAGGLHPQRKTRAAMTNPAKVMDTLRFIVVKVGEVVSFCK